jgi:hypothetical protein
MPSLVTVDFSVFSEKSNVFLVNKFPSPDSFLPHECKKPETHLASGILGGPTCL